VSAGWWRDEVEMADSADRAASVIVVDAQQKVLGVVHLHDLWGLQLV